MRRIGELYVLSVPPDDALDGFEPPALVVVGKQDTVVGFEDQWHLSQRLGHAAYAALEQAGHNVHLDQPHVVRSLLRDWLGRVAAFGRDLSSGARLAESFPRQSGAHRGWGGQ